LTSGPGRSGAYIVQLVAALAVTALVLAACGGSDGNGTSSGQSLDDVLSQVEGLSGQARTKKLAALAADEGELSLYTTSSIELTTELTDAFEDEYDLDVSVYKTGGDALVPRIVEERDAGFHGADLAETNEINLNHLEKADTLTSYRSPSAAGLVTGSQRELWTADKFDTLIAAWNTHNVSAADRPTSYEDLADPRWHGKLALEIEDSSWYKTLRDYWISSGKSPAEADRLFEAIARNSVFTDSRSLIRELLAAGEFDVAPSIQRHNIADMIKDGAPLAYQPVVEPAFTRPDGVGIVEAPPHPAAAVLFVDWLLDEGQEVIKDFGADAARRDLVVEPTIERVPVDVDAFLADEDTWDARYEKLTRLGGTVEDSG
jgi:iron(III) transport system substrate-binding protein